MHKAGLKYAALALGVVLSTGVVFAEEQPARAPAPEAKPAPALPEWLSRVELSGVLFLSYAYELMGRPGNANAFDVSRSYLSVIAKPHEHVRLKFTLDAPSREAITSVSGGATQVRSNAGRFAAMLKHAYLELFELVPGLSVKFGMHDLPWIPFEEKLWGYRFQGPVFADREGYWSSTDLGLGVSYSTKLLEGSLSVVNGETWSRPEVSKHKDVHARVTVRPFSGGALAGLRINAGGSFGYYGGGADSVRGRAIGQLAYEHKHGVLAVEYLRTWDPPRMLVPRQPSLAASTVAIAHGTGWSAFGYLDLGAFGGPDGLRLVGRVEGLDPDKSLADNGHLREIAGIGYRLNKYVQVLVDGEFVQYEPAAVAVGLPREEARLFLHTAVGF